MNREWRILVALEETAVPHPAPLLLGGPDGPLGSPFLIMARVGGFTPVGVLPTPYDHARGRRDLAFALVDALAELAAVPWRERGLDGLGRPERFLHRQVSRWLSQLDGYRTRDIPGLDWVAGWLEASRPPGQPPALMHGDHSPYNVMASPRDTRRLAAVVDWDTGTIGDPLLDVGHLLARWTEPGEEPAIGVWDIEVRDGLPSRAELAARYADRTGADLSALPYYQALALFKLAIILEGSVPRRRGPEAESRAAMVDRLIRYAGLFAHPLRGAVRPRGTGRGEGGGPVTGKEAGHQASDLFGLAGKVAVVTGGSRGIGRAIAAGFAEAGADVVIASRKLGNCAAAAAEISADTGRTIRPVEFHAGHWADCDRLIEVVYGEFGRCDVLVNNAGMSPLYPDLASVTEEYYDKVQGVNLKGPFRLGALAGTRMAEADGGSIINVSSIGSLRPGPDELVYACAKAGLNALTVGLAEAFGPRVRVNAILPGAVLTDIARVWPEDRLRRLSEDVPLGRAGQPGDLVGTALWLASRASQRVTGVLVRVDGGLYRQTG